MTDRRHEPRDKVLFGAVVSTDKRDLTRDCVVRNLSPRGAKLEFGSALGVPAEIGLTIAKKERSLLARVVWRRDNHIGVAFDDAQPSDGDRRLRRLMRINRELKRRVRTLLGEG